LPLCLDRASRVNKTNEPLVLKKIIYWWEKTDNKYIGENVISWPYNIMVKFVGFGA
jgi:hypothetical protein